jgi:predicted DNA-binding protein (UPF0251 family)
MPRPPRSRRVHGPPRFVSFKPAGIPRRQLERLCLRVDEFEALRLADYEGLDQEDAARAMDISPATFSRLIASARFSLIRAIVEGKALEIDGGKVNYVHTLHRCGDCGDEALVKMQASRTGARADGRCCRQCGSGRVEDLIEVMRKHEE